MPALLVRIREFAIILSLHHPVIAVRFLDGQINLHGRPLIGIAVDGACAAHFCDASFDIAQSVARGMFGNIETAAVIADFNSQHSLLKRNMQMHFGCF